MFLTSVFFILFMYHVHLANISSYILYYGIFILLYLMLYCSISQQYAHYIMLTITYCVGVSQGYVAMLQY